MNRLNLYSVTLCVLTVAVTLSAWAVERNDPAARLLDTPADVQRIQLRQAATEPVSYEEVRCTYYAGYMVKEIDRQEVGDEQISVLPAGEGTPHPECKLARSAREIALGGGGGQYLIGAKGVFVLTLFADGANRVTPFSIYDGHTGRLLFKDQMKLDTVRAAELQGSALRLRFDHGVFGSCSIVTGGQACWTSFARETHLPRAVAQLAPPVQACVAGYHSPEFTHPGQDMNATSVIAYTVELTVDMTGTTQVLSRGALSCWPSD